MHKSQELKILGEDMKEGLSSSTGFQFFQKLIHRYDQERANQTKPKNKWAEENGVKLYPSFEWTSQGDLLLNTTNVDYQRQVARVSRGQTLALKMGWIEEPTSGTFRLGPNLWQEFRLDTIPTLPDVQDANKQPTFWKVDGGYLVLNMTCNWRFVNLNDKFRPSTELHPPVPCTCIAMWEPAAWWVVA